MSGGIYSSSRMSPHPSFGPRATGAQAQTDRSTLPPPRGLRELERWPLLPEVTAFFFSGHGRKPPAQTIGPNHRPKPSDCQNGDLPKIEASLLPERFETLSGGALLLPGMRRRKFLRVFLHWLETPGLLRRFIFPDGAKAKRRPCSSGAAVFVLMLDAWNAQRVGKSAKTEHRPRDPQARQT